MEAIRLVKPFNGVHVQAGQDVQIDAGSHFASNLPLYFKLLHSPDWLKINEQGMIVGSVPALKQDTQFTVTVVAWRDKDLLAQELVIDAISTDMFDSLRKPMLELSMKNKPFFATDTTPNTREILTYIFGYYQTQEHGEQFFEKLREKANALNQRLPEVLSIAAVLPFLEKLAPEQQQHILEYAAGPQLWEKAIQQAPRPQQPLASSESLGFPTHELQPHEHTFLEHLYGYFETNHPEHLHNMIYNEAIEMDISLEKKTKFENFVTVVKAKQPEIEEKLEKLADKFPLLRHTPMTDEEFKDAYKESYLVKELKQEQHAIEHMVFCYEEEIHQEELEELFGLVDEKIIQYRHEHPLNTLEFSYDQFHLSPHPYPFASKEPHVK